MLLRLGKGAPQRYLKNWCKHPSLRTPIDHIILFGGSMLAFVRLVKQQRSQHGCIAMNCTSCAAEKEPAPFLNKATVRSSSSAEKGLTRWLNRSFVNEFSPIHSAITPLRRHAGDCSPTNRNSHIQEKEHDSLDRVR